MAEARKRYILLQDRVGYTQERSMLSFGLSVKVIPTQLLKGELLEALAETEQPNDSTRIALSGIDRKNLRLECRMEDIARLTDKDADLLLPISSAGLRYQTFIHRNRLDFGRQISPGSQVFVEVKGVSKKFHGTVWYVGELPPSHGTMFGVELIHNPGQGTSDGTFRNKRYFQCRQDSGVFVALDKLTPFQDLDSKSPKSPNKEESSPGNFASRLFPSFLKGKNDQNVPQKRADYELEKGERVVTFDGDAPVRGTVRYIGEDKDSNGQVHTVVGLELDEMRGSGTGKLRGKQVFVCRKHFAKFVDIETVIPEKDFDQFPEEDTPSPDTSRGEAMPRSMDPFRLSGRESVKKPKRSSSFDSADHNVIMAAGESSQTNCAAFIEEQKQMLHEYNSSKVSLPTTRDVRMSNEERTDSASNMNFNEEHYKNTPPNSDLNNPTPITKQPGLSNVGGRSYCGFVQIEKEDYDKVMQQRKKDLVSPMATDHEVVSDNYSPVETNNMEDSALSKDPAEPQTSVMHVDEQASDKMTDLEAQAIAEIPHGFEVGLMVEVPMAHGLPRYGVIKWIGTLPTLKDKLVAGLELEDEQSACSDGTFGGERYFSCPSGRGFFTLLAHCRQDSRFTPNSPISDPDYQPSKAFGSLPSPEVKGVTIPQSSLLDDHCGSMKGLQGHHNSCYLDATLYAMFAFSMVFDTLLHKEKKQDDLPEYEDVQHVLREAIVNPLRTFGFVRADRILKLRELLDKLSSTAGLVNEEKDPEEFLNSLLKQVLKADPFLHLKSRDERKKDSEGAFFYQIITEKNEAVKIPMVQELLEQSFLSADIILSEVPSCLILQMPRFGSKYKMYDMILPDLELDVTHIVENVARECTVCGSEPAQFECKMCYQKGVVADRAGMPSYCVGCNGKIHGHRDRQHHKTRPVILPRQFQTERWMLDKQKMELFAVVCIETSHYVAFVKCGDGVDKSWCFFDSMADRKGVNVAEEPFHRRFTVVEDFESKSTVIEIHLTSIDMLVSVTVNSVNKSVSSFTTAYLPGKTFTNKMEMEKVKEMDMVKVDTNQSNNGCSITNKAWNSLLSAVKSAVKWLHIGIDWLKNTNSDAFARRTVTASDSVSSADGIVNHSMFIDVTDKDQTLTCPVATSIQLMTLTDSKPDSKSFSKKSEDGKVNTTLPATSLENIEINVTASSGKAEREVNDIMGNGTNKRREPVVVFIGHCDSQELSKDESSEIPKFTSSSFFGLHPEIRSSNRQENDDVMFLGVMGDYGIASHKTVPEYHGTVTSLDRDEDEISTALGTSSTEITHPKENGLALQQKDTEIGTFALLEEPQSTLRNETLSDLVDSTNQTTNFNSEKADERNEDVKIVVDTLILSNDTKEDLRICPNHPQTGGSSFNKVHSGVCMKDGERLGLRIDDLPSLTTQYQDITFLRGSTAKKSRSRWMTKLVKDESTHAFYLTGFNQSGTEYCSKKTSPSVDSSWFIARLWNRGLVSVGLRKPSSVPRQTAKRPQYQRLAAVQISMFEICITETNQTGPETLCCTKKAAKESCQTKSESFTTKLWIKGVEFVGWIRSNETREKAWNLGNFYLTKFLTKMMNWTWQDTFDMMTMILATECCYTAMYLAIPLIINIIKRFIRMLIRKWRLYRKNRQHQLEKERERLRQEELARERAARPKPWRPKQPRKRKINFCGRLQKW